MTSEGDRRLGLSRRSDEAETSWHQRLQSAFVGDDTALSRACHAHPRAQCVQVVSWLDRRDRVDTCAPHDGNAKPSWFRSPMLGGFDPRSEKLFFARRRTGAILGALAIY